MKTGGKVVIYTPNRWSPVTLLARLIPFCFHHHFTHFLWQTEPEDVFPTFYRMNTRKRLRNCSNKAASRGRFRYLGNCTTFQRFRLSCFLELFLSARPPRTRIDLPGERAVGVYEKQ